MHYERGVLIEVGCEDDLLQVQFNGREIASARLDCGEFSSSGNLGANRQNGAWCMTQNVFRDRTQQQFAQSGAAMGSDDDQINLILVHNSSQILPHLAMTDIVMVFESLQMRGNLVESSRRLRYEHLRRSCSC